MSEDGKRIGTGAMVIRTPADDRKPSSASSTSPGLAKKVIIKSADMKEDLQRDAVDIAIAAFEKHNVEKDVAEAIKKEFDRKHGPTWHCIVGKNFGVLAHLGAVVHITATRTSPSKSKSSYVTHETNHFVYFYLDSKAVLLFKSG